MTMLAANTDFVVGVDTHRDTHAFAIVDLTGHVLWRGSSSTRPRMLAELLDRVRRNAPGRRVWAIEQTGSYGAGLTAMLLDADEEVVEIDRPARPARKNGAKTDDLDAVRAAREALTREHLAQPRMRGHREAMRALLVTRAGAVHARKQAICQLKALVVCAPIELREQLRELTTLQLMRRCARLRVLTQHDVERRGSILALRATAQRLAFLTAQADELETELRTLVNTEGPGLLKLPGVGVLVAAQILVLVTSRPRAKRGRLRRPRRHRTTTRLIRAGHAASAQPLR